MCIRDSPSFLFFPVISDDMTLSSLRPGDLRPELLAPAGDMDCALSLIHIYPHGARRRGKAG